MIKTCVLGALALFLVPQAKAAGGDWVDEAVKAKLQLQAKIGKQGQLVASDWIKAKRQACPFSVDIAGNKQLVLLTRGGMDGTRDDHAVWAGARLQKADGSYVWLDE